MERFTEPAILLLLREGAKHGYELLDRLPELSSENGAIDVGNLYRLLRAMEAEGVVSSEWQAEVGSPRRIYRLTAPGAQLLDGWADSLGSVRSSVDHFLTLYVAGR